MSDVQRATKRTGHVFTAEERVAMQERAREQRAAAHRSPAAKPRGWFLTIMIIFLFVGDIQIPYVLWINSDALSSVYKSLPSWYSMYAVAGLASNVAIIIGIWMLKKWAAYLLASYFFSKALFDYFFLQPHSMIGVYVTTIVGAGLWFWAIYRKWELFD